MSQRQSKRDQKTAKDSKREQRRMSKHKQASARMGEQLRAQRGIYKKRDNNKLRGEEGGGKREGKKNKQRSIDNT